MSKSKRLFADDEDSSNEEGQDTLTINKAYADKYEKWREAEELQRLKDKYGDSPSSSDSESSDDEYVNPENPEFDRDFLKTLAAIRTKDSALLKKGAFFKDRYETSKPATDEKPMTIGDMQRQILLDKDGIIEDDDCDDSDLNESKSSKERINYLIKDSSYKAVKKTIGFEDDNVEVSDEDEEVFVKSTSGAKKSQKEQGEDDNVLEFMKGSLNSLKKKDDERLFSGLRTSWEDKKLSSEEKWLKDFFLNKRYLEKESDEVERPPNSFVVDEETISEDEETLNKLDEFETKYRFRFEEPDEDFIKKYPRVLSDTLRLKDDRRKQTRDAKKRRKEEEVDRRRQEVMQLKALKRKELHSKIEEIQKIAGNEIELQESDLEEDFDPAKHDAAMSKIFNEEYYGEDLAEQVKPTFEQDDEIFEDYDDWLQRGSSKGQQGQDDDEGHHYEEGDDPTYDINHPDFNMDADYDPSQEALRKEMLKASSSKRKRTRRKQNKLAEVLEKEKPSYDPNMGSFDDYYDKYYELDFEDIVAGNPVRFKYKTVESNSFGLTTGEILLARDRELNKWYPTKKMLAFNRSSAQETKESKNFEHRASLLKVKQKILPSLFVENQEEILEADQEKKKQKYLKKKLRKQRKLAREGKGGRQDSAGEPSAQPAGSAPPTSAQPPGSAPTSAQPAESTPTSAPPASQRNRKRKRRKMEDGGGTSDPDCLPPQPKEVSDGIVDSKVPQPRKKRKGAEVTTSQEANPTENTVEKAKMDTKDEVKQPNKVGKKSSKSSDKQVKCNKNKPKKKSNNNSLGKESKIDKMFGGISDARLAAYGENPKKLKNRYKYGNKL